MSHTGVEVFDFLLYTIYPVIGIFLVEVVSRLVKSPKWIKLWIQAIVSVGFGIYYWFILPAPQNFPLTAMVMFALAVALIYQGRRAKISPDKSPLLILKSLKDSFEDIWFIAPSVSYYFSLSESFCPDLTEFYTPVFFGKSMFCTKWILAIITLKW